MDTDGSGTIDSQRNFPSIDITRCSGCGRCVAACPQRLITLDTIGHRKTARIITPERCTLCGKCIESCPVQAVIEM